jgi:hypothetical protein
VVEEHEAKQIEEMRMEDGRCEMVCKGGWMAMATSTSTAE